MVQYLSEMLFAENILGGAYIPFLLNPPHEYRPGRNLDLVISLNWFSSCIFYSVVVLYVDLMGAHTNKSSFYDL